MAPMRKVVLAALFASSHSEESCAKGQTGEETSLMQDLVKRNRQTKMEVNLADGVDLKSKQGRHDSLGKLVKTAEHMMKNGATPDVLTFVTKTIESITDSVMPSILDEHTQDQALLNNWLEDFDDAHKAFEAQAPLTDRPDAASVGALTQCRTRESKACGQARVCQQELEVLWDAYVKAENDVRNAHGDIYQHMCPDPQSFPVQEWAPKWQCPNWPEIRNSLPETATQDYCPSGADCPEDCNQVTCTEANGERTCEGAYERIYIDDKATQYREDLKGLFESYMEAKSTLEGGDGSQGFWNEYTKKLAECASLDESLEDITPTCDAMQVELEDDACSHDGEVRVRRKNFGKSLDEAGRLYRIAIHGRDDLAHYNKYVKTVDENGRKFSAPFCPDFNDESLRGANWDSHKFMDNQTTTDLRHSDGTAVTRENIEGGICRLEYDRKREVETLHIVMCLLTKVNQHVTMSIETGEDCITETSNPDQVKNEIDQCHMIAMDGATVDVQDATYTYNQGQLDIDYGKQPLPKIPPRAPDTPCTREFVQFEQDTLMSCAAPKMCLAATEEARPKAGGVDHCDANRPEPADPNYEEKEYVCMLHQSDLQPFQQDADTFMCATGGNCIDVIGRCNGVPNCNDGSDEHHCLDGEADLPMVCSDGSPLAVMSTSGRHSEVVDKIATGDSVYFDRQGAKDGAENPASYNYIAGKRVQAHRPAGNDNVGSKVTSVDPKLEKLKWVKYSNDDKFTPRDHVMLKVSVPSPTKVYVNVVEKVGSTTAHNGWTPAGWKEEISKGVVFKSHFTVNGDDKTTWGNALRVEHFQDGTATITEEFKGKVYSKVFPAGEIMLRGNGGKDGSYLVFLEDLKSQCFKAPYSPWALPPNKPEPPVQPEMPLD